MTNAGTTGAGAPGSGGALAGAGTSGAATGASAGTPSAGAPNGTGGTTPAASPVPVSEDAGCGCRVPDTRRTGALSLYGMALVVIAALRRRRSR